MAKRDKEDDLMGEASVAAAGKKRAVDWAKEKNYVHQKHGQTRAWLHAGALTRNGWDNETMLTEAEYLAGVQLAHGRI